jgi:hypothetical protein
MKAPLAIGSVELNPTSLETRENEIGRMPVGVSDSTRDQSEAGADTIQPSIACRSAASVMCREENLRRFQQFIDRQTLFRLLFQITRKEERTSRPIDTQNERPLVSERPLYARRRPEEPKPTTSRQRAIPSPMNQPYRRDSGTGKPQAVSIPAAQVERVDADAGKQQSAKPTHMVLIPVGQENRIEAPGAERAKRGGKAPLPREPVPPSRSRVNKEVRTGSGTKKDRIALPYGKDDRLQIAADSTACPDRNREREYRQEKPGELNQPASPRSFR